MSALGGLTITSNRDKFLREIGQIDRVHLGTEDHGLFTVELGFSFGAMHQGIGHLCLGSPNHSDGAKWAPGGLALIHEITRICGRANFVDLKGALVLVLRESDQLHSRICGLQQLMGDEMVIFSQYFDEGMA